MSSPVANDSTTGITGLSRDAEIGLAICPILFVMLLIGFYVVSRKRQLCCFRSDDPEVQRQQDTVDRYFERLSAANATRAKKEGLGELHASRPGDESSDPGGLGMQDSSHYTELRTLGSQDHYLPRPAPRALLSPPVSGATKTSSVHK